MPGIDYDQLAQQHGGVPDYDALAAQHGGTSTATTAGRGRTGTRLKGYTDPV